MKRIVIHIRSISSTVAVALMCVGCATRPMDLTENASGACEVHGDTMTRRSVRIVFGSLNPNERNRATMEAFRHSFPHAQDWITGGCCSGVGYPKRAFVFVCTECQRAKHKWQIEYDKERNAG
jgi:hypothetical protein